jgi:hypothetical protein
MKVELNLMGLAEIQELLGAELPEIVGGIAQSMRMAIEEVELAMRSGDLERTAGAAHACRNDALIVGAKQLLSALAELEEAARGGQAEIARQSLAAVREAWPETLDALERAATEI